MAPVPSGDIDLAYFNGDDSDEGKKKKTKKKKNKKSKTKALNRIKTENKVQSF